MNKLHRILCLVLFSLTAGMTLAVAGCGDDVKTERRVETHEESNAEMTSPGEMVVE